jgi:hypothetical protein
MAQVIGGMCLQFDLAFSLEEAPTFGWGSSPIHLLRVYMITLIYILSQMSQNSLNDLSTQSSFRILIPGTLNPTTARLMAIR